MNEGIVFVKRGVDDTAQPLWLAPVSGGKFGDGVEVLSRDVLVRIRSVVQYLAVFLEVHQKARIALDVFLRHEVIGFYDDLTAKLPQVVVSEKIRAWQHFLLQHIDVGEAAHKVLSADALLDLMIHPGELLFLFTAGLFVFLVFVNGAIESVIEVQSEGVIVKCEGGSFSVLNCKTELFQRFLLVFVDKKLAGSKAKIVFGTLKVKAE